MSIQVDCPSCGANNKAPDNLAGQLARCPRCRTSIQVPFVASVLIQPPEPCQIVPPPALAPVPAIPHEEVEPGAAVVPWDSSVPPPLVRQHHESQGAETCLESTGGESGYPQYAERERRTGNPSHRLLLVAVLVVVVGLLVAIPLLAVVGGLLRIGPAAAYANVDYVMEAQELLEAFHDGDNPRPTADATFRGRVIELTGIVAKVDSDSVGTFIDLAIVRPWRGGTVSPAAWYRRISQTALHGFPGVRCYLADGRPGNLRDGDTVRLRGRCMGMPSNVELRQCVIVPNREKE
jgi:hypothetical protein